MMASSKISRSQWEKKYKETLDFMKSRRSIRKILLEVSAQHPLKDGKFPNEEFITRLDKGIELYKSHVEQNFDVQLYIPGSRHQFKGKPDEISLSEAGTKYLADKSIPKENIHGDDLNGRYKGDDGVYNSADESYVASTYFKDENFGQLYSVISPVQLQRKALHYIWFGVLPMFYTAPTIETHHEYLREVYDLIPYVRDVDPTLQSTDSYFGTLWRKERKPEK